MNRSPKTNHPRHRKFVVLRFILLVLQIAAAFAFIVPFVIYVWQFTPIARAGAFQLANDFMSYLHDGHEIAIFDRLCPGELMTYDAENLFSSTSRPASWVLNTIEQNNHITGKVVLADNTELPIKIGLHWSGHWRVCNAVYGGFEGVQLRAGFIVTPTSQSYLLYTQLAGLFVFSVLNLIVRSWITKHESA